VFALGYYAARQKGIGNDFLSAPPLTPAVTKLLEESGSLSARDLIDGQWWRLLAAGFVHIGFMHLLLNMVFLYMAGRYIEQMWGHVRYLVIYLVGLVGGSCLAVAHNVAGGAGASGAVCGLLGAEAVWFVLNRKYLPRSLMRQAKWSLISSFVLLVFISSFKDVSGWGHFGGAAVGALAGLLLHLHRFGPPLYRWLALAGFVPLAWYGHHVIDHARATDERWQEIEDEQFKDRYTGAIVKSMRQAKKIYAEQVTVLLRLDPPDRDADKVESVLTLLAEQQRELNALADRLDRAGPYGSEEAEIARQTGRDYVRAGAELFALADHILRLGEQWTDKDRQALRRQQSKINQLHEDWNKLFE
jgi:membrane associated rhomboid family serine protease